MQRQAPVEQEEERHTIQATPEEEEDLLRLYPEEHESEDPGHWTDLDDVSEPSDDDD